MFRFGKHLENWQLRFPTKILPMIGFLTWDDGNIFWWLKLISIGGTCIEPFSHLQWNVGGCVGDHVGDSASSTESSQSDNRCKPENDVLIDFQTGVTVPVLVRYIYNFGNKYVGAQMLASVFYIPTLVALFGLCFDPTECFWDLCVWYRTMGNMSSKLQYVLQIMIGLVRSSLYLLVQERIQSYMKSQSSQVEQLKHSSHLRLNLKSQGLPAMKIQFWNLHYTPRFK